MAAFAAILFCAITETFISFLQKVVRKFCRLRKSIYFCAAFCLK